MFKGAKAAWPFYLLQPSEVAERIILAIQYEETLVIVPWRGNVIWLLRILPSKLADACTTFLGVNSSMD